MVLHILIILILFTRGENEALSQLDRSQSHLSDFVCQTLVDVKSKHTAGVPADEVS